MAKERSKGKRAKRPRQNPELLRQMESSCSIFSLIRKQHGSVSRCWRIHLQHMRSPSETGAFTPSQQTRILPLFPSQLPWLKVPGKSRGRRGQPQSTRHEALVWMHLLWALFNFLDAGSPSSSDAIRSSVKRSASGGWTATHESYARTMYAKVLNHCAFPRGAMDRGALKLNDLISRIQCSQYDPSLNFDDAVCGAMSVNPSRVSLPEHAGILDVI